LVFGQFMPGQFELAGMIAACLSKGSVEYDKVKPIFGQSAGAVRQNAQ
jgi:hypothetical protein